MTRVSRTGGAADAFGYPAHYRPSRMDFPPVPDPLRPCSRCDHAALFGPDDDGLYYCGVCIGRVDIFHANMVGAKSAVQMRADHELRKAATR